MRLQIKSENNNPIPILKQLAELETMPTKELRKLWDTLHEAQSASEPKANDADNMPAAVRRPRFNRQFLIKHLSYRIQELAFGGLKENTKSRMDRLLDDEGYDDFGMKKVSHSSKSKKTRSDTLLPGTLLVREWRGERHEVIVGENKNFEYLGIPYRSLSAVARKITGTRWNGPKFFGCREEESRTQELTTQESRTQSR